jgi:CheY-like chemotaxis protein
MATILCIDDQQHSLKARKALLELKGYTVLIAINGPAGIELARTASVDLVLLDYKMPGMDGTEVARILKKEQPALKIILLSGFCGDIPADLLSLVEAFVRKGEHISVLLSAVELAVDGSSSHGRLPNRGHAIPGNNRSIA